jgi:hypothetical protein
MTHPRIASDLLGFFDIEKMAGESGVHCFEVEAKS